MTHGANPALVAVVLAFPVAMALAIGTEAPATSIAQLSQLRDAGRCWFGRGTPLTTIVIVGALTIGLTVLAVRLRVGIPQPDETQIANVAPAAAGPGSGLLALFQLSSGLLLLAPASSSFQPGPGLLKALARVRWNHGGGLLPAALGQVNRHHTPVRRGLRAHLRRDHRRGGWAGAGARAGVRRRRVRELAGRPARHGPVLAPPGVARAHRHQRGRGCRRRLHPRHQPRARLSAAGDGRHGRSRRPALRSLGPRGAVRPAWRRSNATQSTRRLGRARPGTPPRWTRTAGPRPEARPRPCDSRRRTGGRPARTLREPAPGPAPARAGGSRRPAR